MHECKRCEMEDRIEAVMSRRQRRPSGQPLTQHVACQTPSADSATPSSNYTELNMSDSCLDSEPHQPPVISKHCCNVFEVIWDCSL